MNPIHNSTTETVQNLGEGWGGWMVVVEGGEFLDDKGGGGGVLGY